MVCTFYELRDRYNGEPEWPSENKKVESDLGESGISMFYVVMNPICKFKPPPSDFNTVLVIEPDFILRLLTHAALSTLRS